MHRNVSGEFILVTNMYRELITLADRSCIIRFLGVILYNDAKVACDISCRTLLAQITSHKNKRDWHDEIHSS